MDTLANIDSIYSASDTSSLYAHSLYNAHSMLAQAVNVSLATIDGDGDLLACASCRDHRLPKVFFASPPIRRKLLDLAKNNSSNCIDYEELIFLFKPIQVNGKFVAYVFMGPVSFEAVPKNQYELHLDSLAEVISEITYMYLQQQESVNIISSFYKINTELSNLWNLSELLPKILHYSINMLKASSGTVTLLDKVHGTMQISFQDGEHVDSIDQVPINGDITNWIKREGVEEVSMNEQSMAIRVPLYWDDECIGFLKIADVPLSFDKSSALNILRIVSSHSGTAIIRTTTYQQSLHRSKELEALQEVGESLNDTSIDVNQTLHKVLNHACSLLNAKSASVMLLDKQDQRYLRIREAKGLSEDIIKNTRVRLGDRVSGKVALLGVPISLPKGYDSHGNLKEAALCVPMKKDNKVIGVLNINGHEKSVGEFTQADLDLATRLAHMSAVALENARMHDEQRTLLLQCITALTNAIDARDPYTRGHSERVTEYSLLIAKRLNFTENEMLDLRNAALLHDIGKLRIRDNILNKSSKLSPEEYEEMQRHPVYGAGIMMPVQSFKKIIPYILHHHEYFNGAGYPDRKQGSEIPLNARIISIADTFDAITSDRPYRKGRSAEEAVNILRKCSGSQFDPDLVNIFVQIYEDGELPQIMKINSNRWFMNSLTSGTNIIKSEEGGKAIIWRQEDASQNVFQPLKQPPRD